MNMRAPHGHLTHTYYHGRKEELGARIPTGISGYKMLDFLAVVLTVGMEETQHVGAKVNVVNVLPSSEL